jgi:hypothetical protein
VCGTDDYADLVIRGHLVIGAVPSGGIAYDQVAGNIHFDAAVIVCDGVAFEVIVGAGG